MRIDTSLMSKRLEMGQAIVRFEGRYCGGNLQGYNLPKGEGGGSFEVAEINECYYSEMASGLPTLIDCGEQKEAEQMAADYIVDYTAGVVDFFPESHNADDYPGIEFGLRDTAFNRGMKGAATVLQLALGMGEVDGVVGPKTQAEFGEQLARADELLNRLTRAREAYERTSYPWKEATRDESSKFWKSLSKRWAEAHTVAGTLAAQNLRSMRRMKVPVVVGVVDPDIGVPISFGTS
jgi:hypothetical protein